MTAIPGIFLSHDAYLDVALFCLRQYGRHWPGCPVRFLAPANSEAAERRIREADLAGLDVEVVMCEAPFRATLAALDRAAGDSAWIFWCSSDRYPVAAAPGALDSVADELLTGDGERLADVSAVRFVRWKEIASIDAAAAQVQLGGETFSTISTAPTGYWHPQFIRREWLRALIDGLAEDATLADVQRLIGRMKSRTPGRTLICGRALMKIEEPVVQGRATLNYAARLARAGENVAGHDVEAVTIAYSSVGAHQANGFWAGAGVSPERVLAAPEDDAPLRVVSCGGVGSKRIVNWLYPDADPAARERAHSHARVPPGSLRAGERFIYVFGDPRDTAVSIFKRREVRHDRHGFGEVNPVRETPAPDFAMRHARNLEVEPEPMTAEWDLDRYLGEQKDVFRFEEHLDFWLYGDTPYEVAFVRYETLWKHGDLLRAYLGVANEPPAFQRRASDWRDLAAPQRELIDRLHGPFARRLEALPDVFRVRGGAATTLDGAPVRFGLI